MKIVHTHEYEEFKTFITDSIKGLKNAEEINNFIAEELNVEFEDELKELISSSTNEPAIAVFIAKHKWVPKAGISSPISGDDQIFTSIQKMLGVVKRHYKLHNKGPIDRNILYYYPIIGEGRWRVKVDDEEKPRLENSPFVCCFHDCNYHCSSEKQRFEHQKNISCKRSAKNTRCRSASQTIDYVNKHNQLPTMKQSLHCIHHLYVKNVLQFRDINAVSQHLFKAQHNKRQITGQHILHANTIWVPKEKKNNYNEANQQESFH